LKNPVTRKRFLQLLLRRFDEGSPSITKRGEAEDLLVGNRSHVELDPSLSVMSDEEFKYYFEQVPDLHGPLCYYRTHEVRYDEENDLETGLFTGKEDGLKNTISPDLPVLFIRGTRDPTSDPSATQQMMFLVPQTKLIEIETGHWITIEAKEIVTGEILNWLKELKL